MIIRKLRLQRGWSQEQLAEMADVSIRTVQRAERGQPMGLETRKALAAVFEVELEALSGEEQGMENRTLDLAAEEAAAMEYVRDLKGFYSHLVLYVATMLGLTVFNLISSPHNFWVIWPMVGWGIGVLSHGASVIELNLFSPQWERKQVEKRLGRKL